MDKVAGFLVALLVVGILVTRHHQPAAASNLHPAPKAKAAPTATVSHR